MKKLIYLLIPVMVMLFACSGNKNTINFENEEEVSQAWADWANQSETNKEALLNDIKDKINADIAKADACHAKKDSLCATIKAKWAEIEASEDVEAQKALLDEIKEMKKSFCKGSCHKEGEGSCHKEGEGSCHKEGEGSCKHAEGEGSCKHAEGEGSCHKEGEGSCKHAEGEGSCHKEGEGSCKSSCQKTDCCKVWADWDNLTADKKAELIDAAIEKHNAQKAECENRKAEAAKAKAEFDAKWQDIDSKTLEEQKAIIDEITASCPNKCQGKEGKCCKKEAEGKCCSKEGEEKSCSKEEGKCCKNHGEK